MNLLKTRSPSIRAGIALSSLAFALAASGTAAAQAADGDKKDEDSIVVVGTLIRGTQATGVQTISVGAEAISDKGASTTNEMLGLIPQISNTFNGRFEQEPRGIAAGISINRPNLRNLPSLNSSSGSLTLVMMDGFRMTPVGVNQSSIDVDIIPAAVIEGVDVLTDGGTSLYGADAVAGVINFRTKRRFDGIKIDGNFGFGTEIKGYQQGDASITAGTSWATGNAYLSVGYSHRDGVQNGETGWMDGTRYKPDGTAIFVGTQCPSAVGTATRWGHYSGASSALWTSNPGFVVNGVAMGSYALGSPCDRDAQSVYLPENTRYNAFGSLSQELADNIDLRVTGYWTKQDKNAFVAPLGFTSAGSTITSGAQVGAIYGNPAVGTVVSIPGGIGFSFETNSAYVRQPNRVGFETWGFTPELTMRLKGDWQLRATVHYGQSTNYQNFPQVNGSVAQAYINSGALNPQNAAAASASVIAAIMDFETVQETKQQMFAFRAVADGPLFALPGGEAKLAVGIEYQNPEVKTRLGTFATGVLGTKPFQRAERNSKSIFGELSLPVADFIDISGSVRYDDYSDFGSTTNPNIGVTIKPVEGLKIFGHWNKSFNAPNPIDLLPLALGRQGSIIYTATNGPTDPLHRWDGLGSKSLILEGPTVGLKPQTAESWAVGFEATPLQGLRFGGEFYSIDLQNALGAVDVLNATTYATFPQFYYYHNDFITNPNLYETLVSSLANADFVRAQIQANDIALVVDRRTSNLNAAKLEGVDFHAYYDTDISLGRLSLGINGTKTTKSALLVSGTPQNTLGLQSPEFTASAFAALNTGHVRTRVTVNYSGKAHDTDRDYLGNVVIIDPFVTANLFLGYDFGETGGPLDKLSLRLSVDNVFNNTPQTVKRAPSGQALSYVGWSLGRIIKLGFSKEF